MNAFRHFLAQMLPIKEAGSKKQNQNALYCATSNNLCFCTTWQNVETRKSHFFTQYAVSVHCQNSTSPSLISYRLYSRLILTLLYGSHNLVVNAFSSVLLGAWFRRKEVESAAAVALFCMHNACAPMRCLPERKNVICDVFDSV